MKKTFLFLLFVMLCCGTAFSAQTEEINAKKNNINTGLTTFVKDLAATVPNTAVNQNVYADAYIGKIFPSIPPHLAVGVNTVFTKLDMAGLKAAGNELGLTMIPDTLYLPTFTADARIGGLFLPFDIGVTFMKLKPIEFLGINIDFTTWGADLRWALMQQGLVKPNISIGVAYYQSEGGIGATSDVASANISYKVKTLSLSAQVSKTFLIVTPFVGGRFVMTETENNYDWQMDSPVISGLTSSLDGSGSYTEKFGKNNQFHAYGGLSFNIFILRLTPSVSYDFTNKILTASFSARIQL